MKRFISFAIAVCIAAALNAQAAKPKAAWETVGNAAFAQTLMYGFAKIALAPDGTLWAMVNNKYTAANLEVFSLAKGAAAWTKAGRGTFYENAYNGSIAIDAAGNPWLATKDAIFTLAGKKWTPTHTGTYWTDSGKQYAKAYELGNFCSIVAGPQGKLYVVNDYYAGVFEKDEVLAAKDWDEKVYDASRQVSFFPIGADKTEYGIGYKAGPNFAGNPVLATVNDTLYLAYDEYRMTSHWGFHVSKWNGSAWSDLGDFGSADNATGGYSEGAAECIALAVSKTGKVFVAYREGSAADSSRQWKASAMAFNGKDDWTDMGKKGFSGGTIEGYPLSAAYDSKDNPYVCYADEGAGTVCVMKFAAGAWTKVGGDVAAGVSPSMVMGPDDTIYVIYREAKKELISVKKLKL